MVMVWLIFYFLTIDIDTFNYAFLLKFHNKAIFKYVSPNPSLKLWSIFSHGGKQMGLTTGAKSTCRFSSTIAETNVDKQINDKKEN